MRKTVLLTVALALVCSACSAPRQVKRTSSRKPPVKKVPAEAPSAESAGAGMSWGDEEPAAARPARTKTPEPAQAETVRVSMEADTEVRAAAPAPAQTRPAAPPPTALKATASSFQPGQNNEPGKAVDGDNDTFWHSAWGPHQPLPESITVDSGVAATVACLTYLPRPGRTGSNGNITKYNVYLSTDDKTYTKVVSNGTWSGDGECKFAYFPATKARYVRLEAVDGVGGFASAADITLSPTQIKYQPNQVTVLSPAHASDISGDTTLKIIAPGLTRAVVKCCKKGKRFGAGSTVGTMDLDAEGRGSIVLPADTFDHGPLSVEVTGFNSRGKGKRSIVLYNRGGRCQTNRVTVLSPAYCADVRGDTKVEIAAPGFTSAVVKCWKQGPGFGTDSTVGTVTLDARGRGSFVFPADAYPHGPLCVRISGSNGRAKDNCYLQLYNKGGVSWDEEMPKGPPPPAAGMSLVFADDFSEPLSISSTDHTARYFDHKPGGGDFSSVPFTGYNTPQNPFAKIDNYLRIRASNRTNSSGLISSMKQDYSGVTASVPCYFECSFIGPNAPGSWPAFWVLTTSNGKDRECDELDIIEAYGGEGPGRPNSDGKYMIASHFWNQGEKGKKQKGVYKPVPMKELGGTSTWSDSFHIYGLKITETDTTYYCDNVAVGHHPTGAVSRKYPFFFMVNIATGGGWPVDLSRYNGVIDMYVKYVRVWAKK